MKIDGLQSQNIYKTFMTNTAHSGNAKQKDVSNVDADRVEISTESADLNEARELARQSGIKNELTTESASHQDKVETIRMMVESGEYNVSSKEIARSILTGNNFDSRA